MKSRRALLLALLPALLLASEDARAFTDEEVFRDFRFEFITPGARAMALGGAYTSIADDGTAAAINPAGLTALARPGGYAEYRSIDRDSDEFGGDVGSPEWDPDTNQPDLPFFRIDAVTDPDSVDDPTFVEFHWPFELQRWGRRLVVSGSRHILASRDRSLGGSNGTEAGFALDGFPPAVVDDELQTYSILSTVSGEISSEVVHWNASVAFEIHEDFSVGLTLSYAELDLDMSSQTRVTDPQELLLDPAHPRLSGQPDSDVIASEINDTDTDLAYSIGIHWQPDSVFAGRPSPWRLGAVLHKGASFATEESITLNGLPERDLTNELVVPDRWVIGASYRTPQHWLFALDIEHVEYSDLLEGFQEGINFLTSERLAEAFSGGRPGGVRYNVDDGTIFRAGAEYVHSFGSSGGRRLRVQAGYFRTPDDRIRMTNFDSGSREINEVYLDSFPGADDENHFTAGVGFDWGNYAVQIAAEDSDLGTQIVGSFSFDLGRSGAASSSRSGGLTR
jgi:long-subunit fatty acid transport protein